VDKEDKMQDFKNLTVWQAARRFTRSLYQLTADFPASEEFGLKAQMRRASISICSNIAEGCGRNDAAKANNRRYRAVPPAA
jgi:four helix bundle protein